MNVFVAGGSGAIGLPLVRALRAAGHQVTALTRSPHGREALRTAGASAAMADALNRPALINAVQAAHPMCVIHELTALPKDGPRRPKDLEPTNRLRIDGTRNLLDAAIAAGARRFIAGSFAPLSPRESNPIPTDDIPAAAVRSMEEQVLEATRRGAIEGIVLRYGLFYGPAPSTTAMVEMIRKRRLPVIRGDASQLPMIHIDDAVSATVRAVEAGRPGGVYDIVDDRAVSLTEVVRTIAERTGSPPPFRVPAWLPRLVAPYLFRVMSIRLPLSNALAKSELGWQPKYPTIREGLADMSSQGV
jgi:nucleoside-diphosphate-sugar epimerase